MKRLLIFSLICFVSGLMTISCRGVQASREEGSATYQPRTAPRAKVTPSVDYDVKGDLISVDVKNNTIMVRAENGMEQTFKFNDQTMVQGLQREGKNQPRTIQVRNLMGKEGSEVTVTWKDEAGAKMATSVDVNQLISKKIEKGRARRIN